MRLSGWKKTIAGDKVRLLMPHATSVNVNSNKTLTQAFRSVKAAATDTELQVIRSDTAVRTARAELWRYLPTNRFPNPNRS